MLAVSDCESSIVCDRKDELNVLKCAIACNAFDIENEMIYISLIARITSAINSKPFGKLLVEITMLRMENSQQVEAASKLLWFCRSIVDELNYFNQIYHHIYE